MGHAMTSILAAGHKPPAASIDCYASCKQDSELTGPSDCRYEGQMQSQRLRMVSDNELRLEQFQAERKDERRRYEDALDRLTQVGHCSSPAAVLHGVPLLHID